jgi:L-aminoadipate-semialdehyde dehydrogenase
VRLAYRSDLFLQARADEMVSQLLFVLSQVADNMTEIVGRYSLVTKTANLLPNVTKELDNSWDGTVVSHFKRNADLYPDRIAVVHNDATLTYRELDQLTAQLANYLRQNGLALEDGVFIYGHRNLSMVWAMMGSFRAGGAVSLMDPVYPSERIINCIKVAPPKCWLSIEAAGPVPKEILDYLAEVGTTIILSLPLPNEAKERGLLNGYSTVFEDNLPIDQDTVGVVTFTSGSTGLPKAVQGRHGPLTHFYPWMKQRFSLSENDHFSMCSGIGHDPLQRDIFTPLYLGATIHVPNAQDIGTPGQLAIWMKKHGITVTHLTPAMGQLLSETVDDTKVETLRVALFVGDKLTKRDVLRLRKVAPQVLAVNMYGSTETQRSVSYYPVPSNEELEKMKEILPVGQGMKDIQLLVLNNERVLGGVGELGEICILFLPSTQEILLEFLSHHCSRLFKEPSTMVR